MQRRPLNLLLAVLVAGISCWSSGCGLSFGTDLPSADSESDQDPSEGVAPDPPGTGGTLLESSSGTGGHLTGSGGETARASQLGGGGAGGGSED